MTQNDKTQEINLTRTVLFLVLGGMLAIASIAEAQEIPRISGYPPGGLQALSPAPNATIYNNTPLLVVQINASHGPYDEDRVVFLFNGRPVQSLEDDFRITDERIEYQVSTLFRLKPGQQNVTVRLDTQSGETHGLDYSFHFDPNPPREGKDGQIFQTILISLATLVGAAVVGILSWILYLTQVRGWSWRKFTIRFRIPREVLTLHVPAGGAAIAAVSAIFLGNPLGLTFRFATEYILLGAVVAGSVPYALDVHYQRIRKRAHERGYAQFLFELADALRGGIDPVKAVHELAKSETGLLREPLRAAADSLRIGRPFETVMLTMATSMDSPLVARYGRLLGEAAKVGGDISDVIYRAAKDMDDMVKIEGERNRAMKTPIMTIYIAFGVLLMMVNTLMDFGPQLADLDISALTSGNLQDAGDVAGGAGGRLTIEQMEIRFFHLLMITSMGTGLLIGAFTDGKLRYGMIHMLVMIGIGGAFYPLFVL